LAERHSSGHIGAYQLLCEECGRGWSDPTERWRLYLNHDDPPLAVAYCPGCAEREFGEDEREVT
jgi:hypothetical protein